MFTRLYTQFFASGDKKTDEVQVPSAKKFSATISLLLILFTLTMLWYTGTGAYALWKYSSLDATTTPSSLSFTYTNLGYDTYAPVAAYTYTLNGKNYEGKATLSSPKARNKQALIDTENKWGKTLTKVWFSSSSPAISSLENVFPYKQVVTGTLMLALWVYLFIIRLRFKF